MSQMKGLYISQVRLGLPVLPDLLCNGLCQITCASRCLLMWPKANMNHIVRTCLLTEFEVSLHHVWLGLCYVSVACKMEAVPDV